MLQLWWGSYTRIHDPVRMKETEVTRIKAVQHVSYPEVVRRVEGSNVEETMVVRLETSVNVTSQ